MNILYYNLIYIYYTYIYILCIILNFFRILIFILLKYITIVDVIKFKYNKPIYFV